MRARRFLIAFLLLTIPLLASVAAEKAPEKEVEANLTTWQQTRDTAVLKARAKEYDYIMDHLLAQELVDAMVKKYGERDWREKFQKEKLDYLPYYFGWLEGCDVKTHGDRVSLLGKHGCYAEFVRANEKYLILDFGQRITSM